MIDNKSIVQKNLPKALLMPGHSGRWWVKTTERWAVAGLFLLGSVGCESYNLQRATFPACGKPSATIGVTTDQLEATLFLTDKQGDIGVIGWAMGDGRNKTGDQVKVAYGKPGTYTVTVILANACDDKFTTSRPITVQN